MLSFSFIELSGQCSAGIITSPLEYTVCEGGSCPYSYTDEEIPAGGSYWWLITNEFSGGTGGTGAPVPINNIPNFFNIDASLGGVLPANGLPNFAGTWVFYSLVSADPNDLINTLCSVTADSVVVTFASDMSPSIELAFDNGMLTSTVTGGLAPFRYEWSDGSTDANIANPISNQLYTVVLTDENGCNATASFLPEPICSAGNISPSGEITLCSGGSVPLEFTDFMWPPGAGFGLTFDNTFGGTGGNDNTLTFTNVPATLDINDDLNGTWSGNGFPPYRGTWAVYGVVYTDPQDPLATICSTSDTLFVTFTDDLAPELNLTQYEGVGTLEILGGLEPYDIVWSNGEVGTEVSGFTDITDLTVTVTDQNGCSNIANITIFPDCFAGTLLTTGNICVADSFNLTIENTMPPSTGGFGWNLSNDFTDGTGGTGSTVSLFNALEDVVFDNDLGGILSSNGLPVLEGTWVFRGYVYSSPNAAASSTCSTTGDSLVVTFIDVPLVATIENIGNTNLTVSTTGGEGPYSYEWSTMEMTDTITNLMDGIYMVTATDANGCETISEITLMGTAVEDLPGLQNFGVSPNPSSGVFELNLKLDQSEDILVRLYNLNGQLIDQLIQEHSSGNNYRIDLADINAGVYILNISVSGIQHSERLIIK